MLCYLLFVISDVHVQSGMISQSECCKMDSNLLLKYMRKHFVFT